MEAIKILSRIKLGILIIATIPVNVLIFMYIYLNKLLNLDDFSLNSILEATKHLYSYNIITFAIDSLYYLFFIWVIIYVIQSYLFLHYRVPAKIFIIIETFALGFLLWYFFLKGMNPLIASVLLVTFLVILVLVILYFIYEKRLKNEKK